MAILDKELIFWNNEVVAAAGISNIDLGAGGDAIGQELTLTIVANEATAAPGSQFILGTGDAEATAEGAGMEASKGTLIMSPVLDGDYPAGAILFQCRMPKGAKRYIFLNEINGGGSNGKKITAYLSKEL